MLLWWFLTTRTALWGQITPFYDWLSQFGAFTAYTTDICAVLMFDLSTRFTNNYERAMPD